MFAKGALALLNDYGGDSSEEDVPGPRVSVKRTHRDEEYPQKRPERLPVPQKFIVNNKDSEHIDNSSEHDGRVRSFAHERGNWATFVYIPFEAKIGMTELLSSIKQIIPEHMDLKISEDFHISLTKTVVLKHHWISPFVKSVKERVENFNKFLILFGGVKVYCNEERTRTFLGIQIRSGYDMLLKLVDSLDRCLEEFELPSFYKDPSFHMSIAWCVGDTEQELGTFVSQINRQLEERMRTLSQDNWYIYAQLLLCKTGNKYFQFALK